ncbi:hypothetical protein OOK31_16345 [Streptomyces sp. NBC_00249]|uniref:hypothetical protein n=1 Tax=Streptomyces sp. NBC_00249 TaxID=2975690 RepID=UPI002255E565|nr:hypothetical protein [Streptomyces sp. NBC_00249]MCX5195455.1 hypothetical protein [Streptomyces sp. NBC_00249]
MTYSHDSSAGQVLRTLLASTPAPAPSVPMGTGLRLVAEGRPARTVGAGVAAAGGVDGETAALLRQLVREHLGDRAERWLGAHDALAAHKGTLPALLAEVPPPAPAAAPGEVRAPAPRSVHTTLALLLEHAPAEHAAVALAALPDRTLDALLASGSLPGPVAVRAVTEYGDSRIRVALARHSRLDTRVLARLVAVGDARVGAAVYRNPRATQSLRRTLAHRSAAVPMDAELRAELTDPGARLPGTWLTPLLGSGDPQLVARALHHGVRTVAQQYALVRVWECAGAGAVRALLADPATARHLAGPVVAAVTGALAEAEAEADGPGALRRLRERCEPYEDPARLPGLLATTRGTSSLRDLLAEPYVQDVAALAEAHAKSPFMPRACEELARHQDADDAQRLAFRLSVLNEPWRTAGRRTGNVRLPARRLAEEPLDPGAARWAEGVVAAGLLDPVELIRTARPAVEAVKALAVLGDRSLLPAAALAELRALTAAHLGDHPEAWTALDTLLPEHRGTLRELITAAARTAPPSPTAPNPGRTGARPDGPAAGPAAPADPPVVFEPPRAPGTPVQRAGLAALDLLRALAPEGAPLPDEPGVLRFLAHHRQADSPGLGTPQWLVRACAARGVAAPAGGWHTPPDRDEVRRELPDTWGSSAEATERAYVQGLLPADELPGLIPARRLLRLPHDWRRLCFPGAWRAAVARLLRSELGADPQAWLRLAETAAAAGGPAAGTGPDGLSWVELLRLARSGGAGGAGLGRPLEEPAAGTSTPRPRTPDEAIRLAERGNHLWVWPAGTLLCLADAEVVDAVLPLLGPDGPWLLAAYALRHDTVPDVVLDRLLALREPRALRLLASYGRRLSEATAERLVGLDDPEVDLVLLHRGCPQHLARRVVARSRPRSAGDGPTVGSLALAELRADPAASPAGGTRWLSSAEPELIEEVFVRQGSELGLVQQVLGCLNLVEHGGAGRLAALVSRDLLGQAVTKLCVKALGSADPAAVLRARADRELAPAKLVARLRKAEHPWQTASAAGAALVGYDWAALEAAHEEDPLPNWRLLVNLRGAPADLRLRHARLLDEPGAQGLPGGPELTRARARYGLGGLYHCPPTAQLDGLLASGALTGSDLLHTAAPAAVTLAYLGAAGRRTDAPAQAGAALAELTGLVAARLGTDPDAWSRVTARLTGRDPGWDPMSPVAALLE